MRRMIILLLILAAVALSTGVVLPRLKPLQPGSDPASDLSSDSHGSLTECEVLRKLYHDKVAWMAAAGRHNSWETTDYNDDHIDRNYAYLNKGEDDWSEDYSFDDTWLSHTRQFSKHQGLETDYLYKPNSYNGEEAEETPILNSKLLYSRIKDIFIQNDNEYYVYDTHASTSSPFDHVENQNNCLYKAMSRASSPSAPTDNLQLSEDRETDLNEISPLVIQLSDKRYDASEAGEKEIPDNLVLNRGKNGEVQKKLFSFWSRLQALSHKGRQLPTRRHTFVYYGPDGTQDGPLTAETRASHLRPPGQPLRWG